MEERWERLEAWLETNAPEFAETLRPPATAAAVDDAAAELGVTFPPSVRQSYRVHDGEERGTWGALGYPLLTLSDVVEEAQSLRAIDDDFDYDFWGDSLIPVLAVGNGDFLCVADAPDGEETALRRWDHETSDRVELAPSFVAFVDAVLDTYEAGDYEYDAELGRLTVDIDIRRT